MHFRIHYYSEKALFPSENKLFYFSGKIKRKRHNDTNRRYPFAEMKNKGRCRCQQNISKHETISRHCIYCCLYWVQSSAKSFSQNIGMRSQFTFRVNLFCDIAGHLVAQVCATIRIKWASNEYQKMKKKKMPLLFVGIQLFHSGDLCADSQFLSRQK